VVDVGAFFEKERDKRSVAHVNGYLENGAVLFVAVVYFERRNKTVG